MNHALFHVDDLSATPTPHDGNDFLHSHHRLQSVDFRGEAITFKATTDGALQVLSHCIDLMSKTEDKWKRRLEKVEEIMNFISNLFWLSNIVYESEVYNALLDKDADVKKFSWIN